MAIQGSSGTLQTITGDPIAIGTPYYPRGMGHPLTPQIGGGIAFGGPDAFGPITDLPLPHTLPAQTDSGDQTTWQGLGYPDRASWVTAGKPGKAGAPATPYVPIEPPVWKAPYSPVGPPDSGQWTTQPAPLDPGSPTFSMPQPFGSSNFPDQSFIGGNDVNTSKGKYNTGPPPIAAPQPVGGLTNPTTPAPPTSAPTNAPSSDLGTIADVYAKLFAGGGGSQDITAAGQNQGNVLLYPINYGPAPIPAQAPMSSLQKIGIIVGILAAAAGIWYYYKHRNK